MKQLLVVAAIWPLVLPSAQASWSTVPLTKNLMATGEVIGAYRSVWGTGPTNVYAAGAGGIIRYDGRRWTREKTPARANVLLQGMWGSGASDIYAVGNHGLVQDRVQGPVVYHFDGTRWIDIWPRLASVLPEGSSGVVLRAVAGAGRDDVYVSGAVTVNARGAALLLHYDGARWSAPLTDADLFISDIFVGGRNDVYAVGSTTAPTSSSRGATTYAAVRHFDGRAWRDLSSSFDSGPGSRFSAIGAAAPGRGNLLLAGGDALYQGDATGWRRLDAGADVIVQKLRPCGPRLCGIVISRGGSVQRLAHWERGQWRTIPLHRDTEPESAWGADGHVFVVGLGPQIFHFDGHGNIEAPAPADDGRKKPPETVLEF